MYAFFVWFGCGIASAIILSIFYYKLRFSDTCPRCKYAYPDRIRRKGLAKRLPLKAYYCTACRHRFYVFNLFTEDPESFILSDAENNTDPPLSNGATLQDKI